MLKARARNLVNHEQPSDRDVCLFVQLARAARAARAARTVCTVRTVRDRYETYEVEAGLPGGQIPNMSTAHTIGSEGRGTVGRCAYRARSEGRGQGLAGWGR